VANATITELRSAVRFPLKLEVNLRANQHEHHAETTDISACGVLLCTEADVAIGSNVEFRITLPAEVLGLSHSIHVNCIGRVVRSTSDHGKRALAAVIDEYRFDRD
jgi:hypothetical protein